MFRNAPDLSKLWDLYREFKLDPTYRDRQIITLDIINETTTIDLEFLERLFEPKIKEPNPTIQVKMYEFTKKTNMIK